MSEQSILGFIVLVALVLCTTSIAGSALYLEPNLVCGPELDTIVLQKDFPYWVFLKRGGCRFVTRRLKKKKMLSMVSLTQAEQQGGHPQHKQIETE